MYTCIYTYMRVLLHWSTYVCMSECVYVRVYAATHTRTHTHTASLSYTQQQQHNMTQRSHPYQPKASVCIYVCIYVTHTRTHTHTDSLTNTQHNSTIRRSDHMPISRKRKQCRCLLILRPCQNGAKPGPRLPP